MDIEKTDVIIIGAGVVGAAVAYECALVGKAVLVLERGPRIAEGVTSRNSGVVHAGLYYAPGSLKAQSCLRGKALLYEWCAAKGVPHRNVGKWVVSRGPEQEAALEELHENARASGATGLKLVGKAELQADMPGVAGERALFS